MPLNSLRDGFVRICFDPSLNVIADGCRVLFEGQYYDPGQGCTVTADELIKVSSDRDIDCRFGEGSVLAEALKKAFACCTNDAVEFFAIPRANAAGSTAAEYTITYTGTATADGRIDIYWGEAQWNISVRITEGMTPTAIAAAIQAAVPSSFPYVATAAAGVVTLVARNTGTVGNNLQVMHNWHERSNYAPAGVSQVFAQTVVGAGNPAPLDYEAILGECCYCCIGMLYDDPDWQDGMIEYIQSAWSCMKPQCFGHGYTYNSGSLGQILATDTNSEEVSRIASCVSDPILGWMQAAAYAVQSCCVTVDNPEISIQGPNFGVLSCLLAPESCTSCFTFAEQEQLKESGFVVTTPLSGGTGALTSPVIANDITNNRFDDNGQTNATFRSVSSRRLAAETADEFAKELQRYNGLGLFTRNTDIKAGVQGTNQRLILGGLRAWAKDNVGRLFSEFDDLDRDLTVLTDFEVAPQCQGDPEKLYVNMVYRPPVRVGEIEVNMKPKLLDNC